MEIDGIEIEQEGSEVRITIDSDCEDNRSIVDITFIEGTRGFTAAEARAIAAALVAVADKIEETT